MSDLSYYDRLLAQPSKVDANRALYQASAKHRLARINHSRRRRGSPEIASLDETTLRIPVAG